MNIKYILVVDSDLEVGPLHKKSQLAWDDKASISSNSTLEAEKFVLLEKELSTEASSYQKSQKNPFGSPHTTAKIPWLSIAPPATAIPNVIPHTTQSP